MYPLLILREEIVCLIVLVFFWVNGQFYWMGKDHGSFLRLYAYAMGHVIFDIITVLTVNHLDAVPAWLNFLAHAFFYLFAILFAHEFFCYVHALCSEGNTQRRVRQWAYVPIALYIVVMPFLPIEYLGGRGTNYSFGMAAFVGYALAMIFFVASVVLVLVRYRALEKHVRYALIPMLAAMVAAELIQIAVPELLFTGGAVTVITVGFFFSLENPAHVFKQKIFVDALTGVKSRHSYEHDMQRLDERYRLHPTNAYGIVLCDINNLKTVNDTLGHLEGDAYIAQIAQILTRHLASASGIYRMGGDEFVAIYSGCEEGTIAREIENVNRACEQRSDGRPYRLSVAIGYAMSGDPLKNLMEVLRVADYMMYQKKAEMKRLRAFVSDDGQKLNISGLTDRIFDSFAATGDRNYLTLCNLSTNVSRWSKSAVDYFDLPGEFMYNFADLWCEYIHPDDRADYRAEITEVMSGKKKQHYLEYRVRNKEGQYVMCTCRGAILRGRNGEPDLFAATLVNHGIAESIDTVTGLHNEQVSLRYVEDRIRAHESVAFLSVSVVGFGRVNLVYGYENGNRILRELLSILKRVTNRSDRIFRMDGPEFLLCLPGRTAQETLAVYKALQDIAYREIELDSFAIPLRLAGGGFLMEERFDGTSTTVRNNLRYALERSKEEYHGRLIFYGDPGLDDMVADYHLLACIHQDAIAERQGFVLHYQPILSMDTGRIIGAEALLRWRNEEFGEVGPGQFVPWLENDPCFYQVGRWILQTAVADAKAMRQIDPDFVVNVNVTVLQLEDERFDSMVQEVLRESGFPPQQLCLELTERCRELDSDFLAQQIRFFHSCGLRVALDDVGTGFSSLGALLKLPVDEIKLDREFIQDIRTRKVNQVVVSTLVEAARDLGYESCLEGVEDQETFDIIRRYGATSCQGYFVSRPVPPDEMCTLLREHQPITARRESAP